MKKTLQVILFISVCFALGGCPYETTIPIDFPSVKIDPKLLGTWTDLKNNNDSYKISKKDEFTYNIVITQKDKKESENYFAYTSMVSRTSFLNLWENKPEERTHSYVLYKLKVKNDNEINLAEVTENIDETFSSSIALKKFISVNMNNSYFYSKEEINLIRPVK